ncbi:MAG: hypothetical protein DMD78_11805 [Candidatus Rokuibacteriota bacterium]|nr:MAG: hypothetical protein DMD78_11805 [Candidatus Rokubacteria bacterium]
MSTRTVFLSSVRSTTFVSWATTTVPCSLLLVAPPRIPPSVSSTPPIPPRSLVLSLFVSLAVRITIAFMVPSTIGTAANAMPPALGGKAAQHAGEKRNGQQEGEA